jgi:hypothetical protein
MVDIFIFGFNSVQVHLSITILLSLFAKIKRNKTNIIIASQLKTGVGPTPETSYVSNIPQTMGNVHKNCGVMNKPSLQTFIKFVNA